MVTFVAINLLVYAITLFSIRKIIINDAEKLNFEVDESALLEKIIALQGTDDDITNLIPLIPIINVVYAVKIIYLFQKYKNSIYNNFYKENIFYQTDEDEIIETDDEYIENLVNGLIKELDGRDYTVEDLIFIKKVLNLLKSKYTNNNDKVHIDVLETKLLDLVDEDEKIKKLRK